MRLIFRVLLSFATVVLIIFSTPIMAAAHDYGSRDTPVAQTGSSVQGSAQPQCGCDHPATTLPEQCQCTTTIPAPTTTQPVVTTTTKPVVTTTTRPTTTTTSVTTPPTWRTVPPITQVVTSTTKPAVTTTTMPVVNLPFTGGVPLPLIVFGFMTLLSGALFLRGRIGQIAHFGFRRH